MPKALITTAAAACLALLTAGCADQARDFGREAGASVDEGGFGNPTMNNILIQSGAQDYTVSLARRFDREVPTTINFAFNSAALDAQAQAVLRRQADWIRQFPEVRFKVFGHTDLVGSNAYNRRLGLRRAQAAVSYLTALGISQSRLEAVVSLGETRPLVFTQSPERQNRRTVTQVTGFVRNHPMILNGKYAQVIFREYVASAVPPSQLGRSTVAAPISGSAN